MTATVVILASSTLIWLGVFVYLLLILRSRNAWWEQREKEWRLREQEYINRLLRQGQVQPLTIEREKVLKIPDPDVAVYAETDVDIAFREDDIKEELEQVYPETAHMSIDAIKRQYGSDWRKMEKRITEQRTAMRAE